MPLEIVRRDDYLMPMQEWVEAVKLKMFTDYDGYGCYSDGTYIENSILVRPSALAKDEIDTTWTHIVWFNR